MVAVCFCCSPLKMNRQTTTPRVKFNYPVRPLVCKQICKSKALVKAGTKVTYFVPATGSAPKTTYSRPEQKPSLTQITSRFTLRLATGAIFPRKLMLNWQQAIREAAQYENPLLMKLLLFMLPTFPGSFRPSGLPRYFLIGPRVRDRSQ